jgi:uncharacterized damage-inducible protein DinB
MTLREFFLERFNAERPVFIRVLRAVPKDKAEYRPAAPSPSAEDLMWKLTNELRVCLQAVVEQKGEWTVETPPPVDEMAAMYEKISEEFVRRVEVMTDSAWTEKAKFFYKGREMSEQPIGAFLWFILFDAIHHRGQLTTYLRPMGSKVPAIYGPSGDEPSVPIT